MTKSGFASGIGALRNVAIAGAVCAVGVLSLSAPPAAHATAVGASTVNVTTYHYDNYRTGWNSGETFLTPQIVLGHVIHGSSFKMTSFTALDDQVDAQPLIMTNQSIAGGTHNVVYVATESNTIYAIDADTGAILLQRNLGKPVPISSLPGGCNNNANNVGIGSTPVIDAANSTMYVIADNQGSTGTQAYHIHALDLSTLKDIVPTVIVKASATLTNGKTYRFSATVSRQRAALLLANGNVYAGFASYCDNAGDQSRGWVLGWQTGTLTPLPHNELTNKLATDPDNFFLSSIWMSGYGLASGGPNGDIYFITGNSDGSGTTIDGVNNIAESAVQMSSDLSTVKGVFTPSNSGTLDQEDGDFGSGGALLLPPQTGQTSDMLVASGKDGNVYLLNSDSLNSTTALLGTYGLGGCWCGHSYFTSSSGTGMVVTSANYNAIIWKVNTGAHTGLKQIAQTASISGQQSPGFFTSISTNGATPNTGIIWAVGRADGSANEYVSLNAFAAQNGATLFTGNAGTWPNTGGNANIVPVEANGHVYVASFQGLAIFGMAPNSVAAAKIPTLPAGYVAARPPLAPGQHEIFGIVHAIDGFNVTVQKRDGTLVTVNALAAAKSFGVAEPTVGHGILARGTYDSAGVMIASVVLHAKDHPAMWSPDR